MAPVAPEATVVEALRGALASGLDAPPPVAPLAAFAAVPDPRRAQGRRFALPAILALAVGALLANHLAVLAIAHGGARQRPALLPALGFRAGTTPHQSTSQRRFRVLDPPALSAAVGHHFAAALPPPQRRGEQGVAIDWPGLAQVCRLERTWRRRGHEPRAIHYGSTSLPPTHADAARRLALTRGHRGIEKGLHYCKALAFGEDRCQARLGAGPMVMATSRDTALSLLHTTGGRDIAARLRHYGPSPGAVVALLRRPISQNA